MVLRYDPFREAHLRRHGLAFSLLDKTTRIGLIIKASELHGRDVATKKVEGIPIPPP